MHHPCWASGNHSRSRVGRLGSGRVLVGEWRVGPRSADGLPERPGCAAPLPVDESRVITAIEHFGPGDVFSGLQGFLRRSPNVRVLLYSNVTELTQDRAEPAVRDVSVACLGGNRFTVRANAYVVAAGTIESARLLLSSRQTTQAGIGNEHDLVGRFYMDHLWISCGRLVPRQPALLNRMGLYDLRTVRGSTIRAKLRLSDELKQRAEILNSAVELLPKPQSDIYAAIMAFRELTRSIRNRQRPVDTVRKLRSIGPGSQVHPRHRRATRHRPTAISPRASITCGSPAVALCLGRPALLNRMGLYDLRTVRGSTIRAKLRLSDEFKQRAGVC